MFSMSGSCSDLRVTTFTKLSALKSHQEGKPFFPLFMTAYFFFQIICEKEDMGKKHDKNPHSL